MKRASLKMVALIAVVVFSLSQAVWAEEGASGGAISAAVVSDIIYIPGKAITCTSSGVLWVVVMTGTFGIFYKEAAKMVHGACTGKWVLTGKDFEDIK